METMLADHKRILIRQKKEWGEILTGFETRNRYALLTEDGEEIGFAAEEGGGIGKNIGRAFLGAARACKIHVYNTNGDAVGHGDKPFRWFFYEMTCYEGDQKIGRIERRFRMMGRRFTVYDADDREILTIDSPLFKIWTFTVLSGEKEIGKISKKWGGMMKEMFTAADTFGIEYRRDVHPDVKKLLLIATFLIDFCCFEKKNN